MNVFKKVLIILLLFFYIFNPPFQFLPFVPKNLMFLVLFLSLINVSFFKKIYTKVIIFKKLVFILFVIFIYCFFREINNDDFFFTKNAINIFFEVLIFPIVLVSIFERNDEDLTTVLVSVVLISSLISIFLFLTPSADTLVKYSLLKTSEFTDRISSRTFGLSEGLTFYYGITLGFIAGLCLFFSKNKKKILLIIPFLIFGVMINARLGLLVFLLGFLMNIIFDLNYKNIAGTILLSVILWLFYDNIDYFFQDNTDTLKWSMQFFVEIEDFLFGTNKATYSTVDTLTNDMLFFPSEPFEIIFGSGRNIFMEYGNNSDIGYVLQIYFGGLIYLIFIFIFIFFLMYYYKKIEFKYKYFLFYFLIVFIICNFKGDLFTPNIFLRIIFLMYFQFYFQSKTNYLKLKNEY